MARTMMVTDDLTGQPVTDADAQPVKVNYDGTDYELDLSGESRAALAALFTDHDAASLRALFLRGQSGKRRRSGSRSTGSASTGSASTGSASTGSPNADKPDRDWLRANGFPALPDRGKLPTDARKAWDAHAAAAASVTPIKPDGDSKPDGDPAAS
jgi:hypothetical protein